MSRPSIHTTGSLPGLPWSCQVHEGVMMKSPGNMVVRSPSTAVYAPEPSTMKRSADCEWRWLGAISPGRISCRPAYRLCVMQDSPRMPGFSRISTRRIASFAVISLPASIR